MKILTKDIDVEGLVLALIMLVLVLASGLILYLGILLKGFTVLIFILSTLTLSLGFKELKGSQPRQIGLVLWFGIRTTKVVEGITFVIDWIPLFKIREVSVFDVTLQDSGEIKVPDIKSKDRAHMDVTGSIAFKLSTKDDPIHSPRALKAGQKIAKYDDAKGAEAIMGLFTEIAQLQLQEIAKTMDREALEWESLAVSNRVRTHLTGLATGDIATTDDLSGLGVEIEKCVFKFRSREPLKDADEDQLVEKLQRKADVENIQAFQESVDLLMADYLREREARIANGEKLDQIKPTYNEALQDARKQVDQQRALKANKRTIIETNPTLTSFSLDGLADNKTKNK